MTEQEFWTALAETKDKFKWYMITHKPATMGICNETIRSTYKDDEQQFFVFCPITAVCFDQGKGYHTPSYYKYAAELISLDPIFAEFVMATADDDLRYDFDIKIFIHLVEYRKKMIEVLGL